MRKITKKIIAGVLACAMTMASSAMTFALTSDDFEKKFEPLTTADITASNPVLNEDGTVSITLSTTGDMGSFEYGIAYDSSTVSVKDVQWDMGYAGKMLGISGIMAFNNFADLEYCTVGGTAASETNTWYESWDGVIATVIFDVADGVELEDIAPIKIVYDPSYFKNEVFDKGLQPEGETMYDFDTTSIIPDDVDAKPPVDYDLAEELTGGDVTEPTPTPGGDENEPTPTPNVDDNNNNQGGNQGENQGGNQGGNNQGNTGDNKDNTAKSAAPAAATTAASAKPVKAATTGDAGIVLPLIAICGAAAAVVVASKRRVED